MVVLLVLAVTACGGIDPGGGAGTSGAVAAGSTGGDAACEAQCVASAHPEAPTFYASADGGLLPGRHCDEITSATAASLPCHGSDATPAAGYLVCCAYSTDPAFTFALASRSVVPGGPADPCRAQLEDVGRTKACALATVLTGLPKASGMAWSCPGGHEEVLGTLAADGGSIVLNGDVTCCCP